MLARLGLLLYVLLCIVPLALGLGYVAAYSLGMIGLLNHGFTTAHWQAVLQDKAFWQSLGFSLYCAFSSMSIVLISASVLLMALRQQLSRGYLSYFIYFPLVLPTLVAAFICFQLWSKSGFISRLFFQIGLLPNLEAFPEFVNDPWGLGIIFTHAFMATPFFTLLFLQLYQSEKIQALQNLALTLGATPGQTWRKVALPILWQKSVFSIFLYFIFIMGAYETPLLLGSQSPQMIAPLIIRKLQKFNLQDIPQAYAITTAYLLLLMGVAVAVLRNLKTRAV
jgi:putative spermidine/putrescine transport system permease protein